jgi:hypothetical protein
VRYGTCVITIHFDRLGVQPAPPKPVRPPPDTMLRAPEPTTAVVRRPLVPSIDPKLAELFASGAEHVARGVEHVARRLERPTAPRQRSTRSHGRGRDPPS